MMPKPSKLDWIVQKVRWRNGHKKGTNTTLCKVTKAIKTTDLVKKSIFLFCVAISNFSKGNWNSLFPKLENNGWEGIFDSFQLQPQHAENSHCSTIGFYNCCKGKTNHLKWKIAFEHNDLEKSTTNYLHTNIFQGFLRSQKYFLADFEKVKYHDLFGVCVFL